jgi:hypothetical protein
MEYEDCAGDGFGDEGESFISEALCEPFDGPTIVMTHHAPSALLVGVRRRREARAQRFLTSYRCGTPCCHDRPSDGRVERGSVDGGSVARALPAVDVEGLSGHEGGRFEIEDGVHDIGDLAHSAERVESAERLMRLDGMHRRLNDARRDRVHPECRASRIRLPATLVAAPRPRFVRDASTEGT